MTDPQQVVVFGGYNDVQFTQEGAVFQETGQMRIITLTDEQIWRDDAIRRADGLRNVVTRDQVNELLGVDPARMRGGPEDDPPVTTEPLHRVWATVVTEHGDFNTPSRSYIRITSTEPSAMDVPAAATAAISVRSLGYITLGDSITSGNPAAAGVEPERLPVWVDGRAAETVTSVMHPFHQGMAIGERIRRRFSGFRLGPGRPGPNGEGLREFDTIPDGYDAEREARNLAALRQAAARVRAAREAALTTESVVERIDQQLAAVDAAPVPGPGVAGADTEWSAHVARVSEMPPEGWECQACYAETKMPWEPERSVPGHITNLETFCELHGGPIPHLAPPELKVLPVDGNPVPPTREQDWTRQVAEQIIAEGYRPALGVITGITES